MFYIYVIKSLHYGNRYTGSTDNILKRIKEHNNGRCRYTSSRKPWMLVYQEEYLTRGDAMKREKFLKSGQGRKFLDELLMINVGSQP